MLVNYHVLFFDRIDNVDVFRSLNGSTQQLKRLDPWNDLIANPRRTKRVIQPENAPVRSVLMTKPKSQFAKRIALYRQSATRSEKRILLYLEQHVADLPFETAASIASKTGVSAMTTGRLFRQLGYDGFDQLKEDIRREPVRAAWQAHDSFSALRHDLESGSLTGELLEKQIAMLGRVFSLAKQPQWRKATSTISKAKAVHVASFQNIRGLAMTFAAQLEYARENVLFSDGLNGTYSELLLGSPAGKCLILVDSSRFAANAQKLAEAARKRKIPVICITDELCAWANALSDIWLAVPDMEWRAWDSLLPLSAVLDLLLTSTIIEIGDSADRRAREIEALQDHFGDFSDD